MVKILGHRGIRQTENPSLPYQNTIEAFNYAIEKKADGFELDIITNKDGKCFVIHDDDISKHSNLSAGFISELNSNEIKQKTVGNKTHYKIPTLEEVLSTFKNKNVLINIEMKSQGIADNVIKDIISTKYPTENIIISSFNHLDLHEAREINKNIKVGILFGQEAKKNKFFEDYALNLAEKLEPSVYCMEKTIPFLRILESKKEKYIWTVNKEDISNFTVEGLLMYENINLITDYPEELVKNLK